MWAMWVTIMLLVVIAFAVWVTKARADMPGLRLLKKLPSLDDEIKHALKKKYSDLHYLLEMVHVNRNRLPFVKYDKD